MTIDEYSPVDRISPARPPEVIDYFDDPQWSALIDYIKIQFNDAAPEDTQRLVQFCHDCYSSGGLLETAQDRVRDFENAAWQRLAQTILARGDISGQLRTHLLALSDQGWREGAPFSDVITGVGRWYNLITLLQELRDRYPTIGNALVELCDYGLEEGLPLDTIKDAAIQRIEELAASEDKRAQLAMSA